MMHPNGTVRRVALIVGLVGVIGATGCSRRRAESAPSDGVVRRGSALTLAAAEEVTVDRILEAPEQFTGPVRVRARVTKVCQSMGCWLQLASSGDPERGLRVVARDHAWVVPFDSAGRTAVAEGTVNVQPLSAAESAHLAEDEGVDPARVKAAAAARREVQIIANGVELRPSGS